MRTTLWMCVCRQYVDLSQKPCGRLGFISEPKVHGHVQRLILLLPLDMCSVREDLVVPIRGQQQRLACSQRTAERPAALQGSLPAPIWMSEIDRCRKDDARSAGGRIDWLAREVGRPRVAEDSLRTRRVLELFDVFGREEQQLLCPGDLSERIRERSRCAGELERGQDGAGGTDTGTARWPGRACSLDASKGCRLFEPLAGYRQPRDHLREEVLILVIM